jgi:two-component system sensor histidine kinase/response regulator
MNMSNPDHLLVVDDSPDNLFLVQTILEEEGYEISLAEDGPTALAHIAKSPPDLVLLDVMMPGMDGYEVTRRIREQPGLPFMPILLITAYDKPSMVQGLDMGADDFIRKPIEVDELLARVRSLLRLKHSVEERDRIARQREDFVSRLTHDLRTPMVAAERMLNLLLQGALGELSAEMKQAIAIMARSNSNLLEMVNTLLEVYRFEAGSKTMLFSAVDLASLLEEVVQELTPLATEKHLSLKFHLVQNLVPATTTISGDRLELHRLFTNLVGNAIKFTDTGSIDIELNTEVISPNSGISWAAIMVQDTGIGISPAFQTQLFERFRPGAHRRSSSGLGLHLSRRIVEAHRGKIEVKSEVGQGSVFTVRLPLGNE